MSKKIQIRRRIRTSVEAVARTRAEWPGMLAKIGASPETHAICLSVHRGKVSLGAAPHWAVNGVYTHDGVCRHPVLAKPVQPGLVRAHVLGTTHTKPFVFDLPAVQS